jgi:hypothetical protein
MQLWQYCLLATGRSLYMFRTLSAPIIRSTKNCSTLGLLSTAHSAVDNRPWTYLLDIDHPDPRHAPVAVTTVFNTPDDGCRKRPKHVEVILQLLINNTAKVAPRWFFI